MNLAEHLEALAAEAAETNERRMLVLEGDRHRRGDVLQLVADLAADHGGWTALGDIDGPWETLPLNRTDRLLGRTINGLLIDATDALRPNVIGQSVGAVAGGGLVVLLIGSTDTWIEGPLASDRRLAVPPYQPADVSHRFRQRFVETLIQHRGVSVYDTERDELTVDGTTGPGSPPATCAADIEPDAEVDPDLLAACLTPDQRRCVGALSGLRDDAVAVVEAHRGRGKSAAAGIAAAGFARDGATVIVTGPGRDAVAEVFDRAAAVLDTVVVEEPQRCVHPPGGRGRIAYHPVHELSDASATADLLVVDEAAALPVDRLRSALDAPCPVAYLTTVHGYEGTGRGFAVRFRDHLDASDRPIDRLRLDAPIRYRLGDPIESWQFRALLLDASPPADATVAGSTPASTSYVAVDRDDLVEDEATLRELFGLLVLAHYRTEPDDLLRLLDAPNVRVRALYEGDHPVSVAMLAEEGGLDDDWRDRLYAGESIRGHMIPDLLTTQLRDREAGASTGVRVLRIATHDAARSRGLGTYLLASIHTEFGDEVDWFGAGFGATPRLVGFWRDAGYRPVHLGTSRNPRSGEHSAVLMRAASSDGTKLLDRHERRLVERLPGQLPDALRRVEPELIVTIAEACTAEVDVDVPTWMWAAVEAAERGPGQVAIAPEAFNRLALAGLVAGAGDDLTTDERSLVVRRLLQSWPLWEAADETGLTLGDARASLRTGIGTLRSHVDPPR